MDKQITQRTNANHGPMWTNAFMPHIMANEMAASQRKQNLMSLDPEVQRQIVQQLMAQPQQSQVIPGGGGGVGYF